MSAEIYGLCDPETGELMYVGKVACHKKRLASHLRDAFRRSTPVCLWLRELCQSGKNPEVVILRSSVQDWGTEERKVIAAARTISPLLLNVADGGALPYMKASQRAENGRKSAASRDPFRWRTLRNLGAWASKAEREGNSEKAVKFREAQAKARAFTTDQWDALKLKREA